MHEGESRKLELEQAGHHRTRDRSVTGLLQTFAGQSTTDVNLLVDGEPNDAEILQHRRGAHEGGDEEQESPCRVRVVSRNASNRRAGTYLPSLRARSDAFPDG